MEKTCNILANGIYNLVTRCISTIYKSVYTPGKRVTGETGS